MKIMEMIDPPDDAPMDGVRGILHTSKLKDGGYQEYVSYWGATSDIRSASIIHKRYFTGSKMTPWIQISTTRK
jgi:hypothetical protein